MRRNKANSHKADWKGYYVAEPRNSYTFKHSTMVVVLDGEVSVGATLLKESEYTTVEAGTSISSDDGIVLVYNSRKS